MRLIGTGKACAIVMIAQALQDVNGKSQFDHCCALGADVQHMAAVLAKSAFHGINELLEHVRRYEVQRRSSKATAMNAPGALLQQHILSQSEG